MTSILLAILIQAPYNPEPVKLPESHIIIERFMLKGEETKSLDPDRKELGEIYF